MTYYNLYGKILFCSSHFYTQFNWILTLVQFNYPIFKKIQLSFDDKFILIFIIIYILNYFLKNEVNLNI